MPLRYSCFISYYHHTEYSLLLDRFISELTDALRSSLAALFTDLTVYRDEDRLQPGYDYNHALAQSICESVCMIVIYGPPYAERSYCIREFMAMEQIEAQRSRKIGSAWPREYRLIIPILFRGKAEELPPKIREHRQFCDFRKFSTSDRKIIEDERYVKKIDQIAEYIYQVYKLCSTWCAEAKKGLCSHWGIRLKRDSWVSVMYAEELNSAKSSATLQSTDRHGILGQKSSHFQVLL